MAGAWGVAPGLRAAAPAGSVAGGRPATTLTGASGVAGWSAASSERVRGRPPFSWSATSCRSKGGGACGGGERDTTGRCSSADGGRATRRASPAPSTLWRVGTIAGAAATTTAAASTEEESGVTCPLTRCPEVKVLRGTAVTAAGVPFM